MPGKAKQQVNKVVRKRAAKPRSKQKSTKTKTQSISLPVSKVEQWSNCPGSLYFTKRPALFDEKHAADAGTNLHAIAYSISTRKKTLEDFDLEPDDTRLLTRWFDVVSLYDAPDNVLNFEYPLQYENIKGTADLIVWNASKQQVTVLDFKTGYLEAGFEQLELYALLFCTQEKLDLASVRLEIIQPNLGDKIQTLDPLSLSDIRKRLDVIIEQTGTPNLSPGKHCTYCHANDVCPSFGKLLKEFLNPEYLEKEFNRLENWVSILEYAKPVRKVLEQIESNALRYAQDFGLEGYEVVYRSGNRQWLKELANDKQLVRLFGALAIESKLATPAAIERAGHNVDSFVYTPKIASLKRVAQ